MATSVHPSAPGSTGYAYLPLMSPADTWQVQWPQVSVSCYGDAMTCYQGELVPGSPYADEAEQRHVLAGAGALRSVTAYATTTAMRAAVAAAAAIQLAADKRRLADAGTTIPATASPVAVVQVDGCYYAGPTT